MSGCFFCRFVRLGFYNLQLQQHTQTSTSLSGLLHPHVKAPLTHVHNKHLTLRDT